MRPASEGALRTRVYVDGYNLYHGCLKYTADRWLDLRTLLERVIANVPYERRGEAMIRQQTSVVLGLIAPIREGDGRSRVNRELNKHAHWTRTHILDEEFAASHLPPMVRLKSGAVHKPLSWYPCPELLIPIFEEAKRVRGSNGAARRWLNERCKQLGNRVPIEMCSSQESARELLEYMRRYAIECYV